MPSNFSPSSWMSVFALIKRKSISFFFSGKRHCSGEHFPRVSSHVSAAHVRWAGRSQRDPRAEMKVWGFASFEEGIDFKFSNHFAPLSMNLTAWKP